MKENKILKWALILSAVIVANLFFNYALSLSFNGPNRDEFCPFEKTSQVIDTKEACEEADGIWNPQTPKPVYIDDVQRENFGYCDLYSKCENTYMDALKIYEKKVFIALVIIGVILFVISIFVKNNSAVTSALAITGLLDLIVASVRYWQFSDELLKVSILFVALVVIFYLIVKKFRES